MFCVSQKEDWYYLRNSKKILANNFVQSFYLIHTHIYFSFAKALPTITNTEILWTSIISANTREERDFYIYIFLFIQLYYINWMNSGWIIRKIGRFANPFPFFPRRRITTRGSWIWTCRSRDFWAALVSDTCKDSRWKEGLRSNYGKGRSRGWEKRGDERKERKRKDTREKGVEKNETQLVDGVDRFVWSLIWSQESIPLLFRSFLRFPPASTRIPPAATSFFTPRRTPLAAPSPSRSFSLRFLRALPATVLWWWWLQCASQDLYLSLRHTRAFL